MLWSAYERKIRGKDAINMLVDSHCLMAYGLFLIIRSWKLNSKDKVNHMIFMSEEIEENKDEEIRRKI